MTITRKRRPAAARRKSGRVRGGLLLWLGALLALTGGGCFGGHPRGSLSPDSMEVLLPKLTAVTAGPVAVLLTNANGYKADFTMAFGDGSKVSGWLVAGGGQFRLDVVPVKAKGKIDAGFGVIWDAAGGQGYVFSDALQGYAAISSTVRFTNVLTEVVDMEPDRIEGHEVEKVNAMVLGDDGRRTPLQWLRAPDLGGAPLQVYSADRPHSFELSLKKLQPAGAEADLFLPPDGFTKYDTASALISELAIRQQAGLEGGSTRMSPSEVPPPQGIQNNTPAY